MNEDNSGITAPLENELIEMEERLELEAVEEYWQELAETAFPVDNESITDDLEAIDHLFD